MLETTNVDMLDTEPMTTLAIDPGRQIFTLVPELAEYTPADAAAELDRVPFAEKKESQIKLFLGESKYEQATAMEKLIKKQHAEVQYLPIFSAPARWQYTIRDQKTLKAVVRRQNGSLIEQVQPRDTVRNQSKWER